MQQGSLIHVNKTFRKHAQCFITRQFWYMILYNTLPDLHAPNLFLGGNWQKISRNHTILISQFTEMSAPVLTGHHRFVHELVPCSDRAGAAGEPGIKSRLVDQPQIMTMPMREAPSKAANHRQTGRLSATFLTGVYPLASKWLMAT